MQGLFIQKGGTHEKPTSITRDSTPPGNLDDFLPHPGGTPAKTDPANLLSIAPARSGRTTPEFVTARQTRAQRQVCQPVNPALEDYKYRSIQGA